MGIDDLKEKPVCDDIEHPHVKTILYMYSLESFLFKRINLTSRERDVSVLKNLGPLAVALTRIINNVQKNRIDSIKGKFVCYRGIAIPQ